MPSPLGLAIVLSAPSGRKKALSSICCPFERGSAKGSAPRRSEEYTRNNSPSLFVHVSSVLFQHAIHPLV
jgi:hypothetical protein